MKRYEQAGEDPMAKFTQGRPPKAKDASKTLARVRNALEEGADGDNINSGKDTFRKSQPEEDGINKQLSKRAREEADARKRRLALAKKVRQTHIKSQLRLRVSNVYFPYPIRQLPRLHSKI